LPASLEEFLEPARGLSKRAHQPPWSVIRSHILLKTFVCRISDHRSFLLVAMSPAAKQEKARSWAAPEKQDDLVQVLVAYFGRNPKRVEAYGPSMQRRALQMHSPLLKALRKNQSNLSFTPALMKATLVTTAESHPYWKFNKVDVEAFACRVEPHIRLMCPHVQQALTKKATPLWARKSCLGDEIRIWILSGSGIHISRAH
jgi:hypothetical protein